VSAGCANTIVCASGAAVTWKERVTSVAERYAALPVCVATTVQVPVARSTTDVPETVQTAVVDDVSETGRPLDADAVSATGPWSERVSAGCAKVIVCVSGAAVT
jgi:hypothetical protein